MTTAAKTSFGTKIYKGGTGTPKTGGTLVEEVNSIELPEEVADAIEAVSHDATTAESIPGGLTDPGEVSFTLLYSGDTGQTAVRTALGAAASQWYINLAGGSSQKQLDFMAIVTSFKLGTAARGNAITATCKLRVTGAITFNTQS